MIVAWIAEYNQGLMQGGMGAIARWWISIPPHNFIPFFDKLF
jgi:hypothetical protein